MRVPEDLKVADGLLRLYGQWAKDRTKQQRCGCAEGKYKHLELLASTPSETKVIEQMPEFIAFEVQQSLNAVPLQYRRVLQVEYIPQRESPMAARRKLKIKSDLWTASHLAGLRIFDDVHRQRNRKN